MANGAGEAKTSYGDEDLTFEDSASLVLNLALHQMAKYAFSGISQEAQRFVRAIDAPGWDQPNRDDLGMRVLQPGSKAAGLQPRRAHFCLGRCVARSGRWAHSVAMMTPSLLRNSVAVRA